MARVTGVPTFRVVVHGRGHWIAVDGELQRVEFYVARVLEAAGARGASRRSLDLVRDDPRAQPLPGHPPPTLAVDDVTPADAAPAVQPGFAFYRDSE